MATPLPGTPRVSQHARYDDDWNEASTSADAQLQLKRRAAGHVQRFARGMLGRGLD